LEKCIKKRGEGGEMARRKGWGEGEKKWSDWNSVAGNDTS